MRIAAVLVALSVSTDIAAITEIKTPGRDPFSIPTQLKLKLQKQITKRNLSEPKHQHIPWSPKLIATIVSDENSIANIDGKILKLGQRIDGYQLVEVARYSATFQKKGKKYKFNLYETEKSE